VSVFVFLLRIVCSRSGCSLFVPQLVTLPCTVAVVTPLILMQCGTWLPAYLSASCLGCAAAWMCWLARCQVLLSLAQDYPYTAAYPHLSLAVALLQHPAALRVLTSHSDFVGVVEGSADTQGAQSQRSAAAGCLTSGWRGCRDGASQERMRQSHPASSPPNGQGNAVPTCSSANPAGKPLTRAALGGSRDMMNIHCGSPFECCQGHHDVDAAKCAAGAASASPYKVDLRQAVQHACQFFKLPLCERRKIRAVSGCLLTHCRVDGTQAAGTELLQLLMAVPWSSSRHSSSSRQQQPCSGMTAAVKTARCWCFSGSCCRRTRDALRDVASSGP